MRRRWLRALAIGAPLVILVGVSLNVWLNTRFGPPSPEERTRATALAQADHPLLEVVGSAMLRDVGAHEIAVTYDHDAGECFTDRMVPNGSRSEYSKRARVEVSQEESLRRGRRYLAPLNATPFGGRGQLSDDEDLAVRRTVSLLADGFNFSFGERGTEIFGIAVQAPCRTG